MTQLYFTYLFIYRERGREKARQRNTDVRENDELPLASPQLGTWLTTQACALTWN